MKKKIFALAVLLAIATSFQGCNLDRPVDNPPVEDMLKSTMPQVQYLLGFWTGSDMARYQLVWMQQKGGIRGSHLQVDRYNMNPSYLDGVWKYFYYNLYLNIQNMITQSNEIEAPAYRGISRVMMAYSLGFMTDTWGDVPYDYGLSYFSNIYPQYDEQNQVYIYIFDLLQAGINDLNQAIAGTGAVPDGEADWIYQGDLDKWRRAAYVIRMRHLLRMANITGDYESILAGTPGNTFTGIQDDMLFYFDPSANLVNPHYVYDTQIRNTRAGKFIVDKLKETNDPRLPVYIKKNDDDEYVGTAAGQGLVGASFLGLTIAAAGAPVPLITYTEQKFIEAEVYYRNQLHELADQAFEEAVKSSLVFHNVSDPEWEAEHAEIENVSLEQIINAKYVALFLQPEVWSDYRRTGYPQLTPYNAEENEEAEIPRRFVYPQEEQIFNSTNVPEGIDIYTRMWWDGGADEMQP